MQNVHSNIPDLFETIRPILLSIYLNQRGPWEGIPMQTLQF